MGDLLPSKDRTTDDLLHSKDRATYSVGKMVTNSAEIDER